MSILAPEPTSSTSEPEPTGLNCRVCAGENGECQDANDNGESKTCPTNAGDQVCLFIEDCKEHQQL